MHDKHPSSNSDRLRAESRAAELQPRLFDQLLSSITDFAYTFDLDGRFTFANKPLLDLWGLSLDEALGKNFHDLRYPPDLASKLQQQIQDVIRTRQPLLDETTYTSASGAGGFYQYIFSPVIGADGLVEAVAGTTRDITHRKLAEARDGFLVALDDALRPLTIPAEITLSAAKLLGEHMAADRCAYAHIESDQDTMNLMGNYTRGADTISIVGRMKFADFGAEVLQLMRENKPYVVNDVDTHSPPVGDPAAYRATQIQAVICAPLHKNGKFVGAMAVHQRVPREWTADEVELVRRVAARCWESIERGRVERILRQSEARFRQLAETVPQMVWVTRPDGYHEYYNRRWYEFTGVPDGSTDGEGWNEMFHPDDRENAWARWRQSLQTGAPYEIEYRLRHHSGEYRWTLGRALAVRDQHGQIERWFGTCTDIDSLKKLTAEREQLLESERAARAEAEHAGRLKDEFLATLSHELRTPLNAILGWCQILARGGRQDDRDLADGLRTIERNARAQTQIIEDLLDMSRIISGKVRLDVQQIHLAPTVQAAIDTMKPAADAKGIRLTTVIDPADSLVSGDANRLQQVFWNLLSNAVKFTPRDGRVQVALERVNSHVEVSVSDTGEGIKPEFLPYVFDRFRQADATTTRKYGGLGLGLAIVRQLVELHGGSVRVKSSGQGRGSAFTVSLPLAALHSPAKAAPDQSEPAGTVPNSSDECSALEGIKVLVVDDEPDARALLRWFLEDCGAIVTTVETGEQAARELQSFRPDVFVSDIGMPGEDGYALIRRVRQLGAARGGDVPAIALTAYARVEDRVRCIASGFQMHVAKPVESAELVTMVASLARRTAR